MIVYLGCYTDEANPNGLKALELDQATGVMSICAESPVSNAIYQGLSLDGNYLYSCTGEGLVSFKVNGQADSQHILEQVDSVKLGNCVCHVAVMPDGNQVVFADYLGGFAGSIEVEDGRKSRRRERGVALGYENHIRGTRKTLHKCSYTNAA
ncbi:MAG: beta-propeller fold lactonase family protein [Kiritimatiellae bacterium]|nr:beta-propeller fold lactonase family protein [Kiritimatiellia bacterium]